MFAMVAVRAVGFSLRPIVAARLAAGELVDEDLWRQAYPSVDREGGRLPVVKNRLRLRGPQREH
jgi:hypothetical protein